MSLLNQTESEKLVSNLRGEVGEIIEGYTLLRFYDAKAYQLQTNDILKDAENNELQIINKTRSKFRNDIILRLSELSSSKHGRLNFYFAAEKFNIQKSEVSAFKQFLNKKHLVFKRNNNIAHKKLSPRWKQIDPDPYISRCSILRAIGWTITLMKMIDESIMDKILRNYGELKGEKGMSWECPLQLDICFYLI